MGKKLPVTAVESSYPDAVAAALRDELGDSHRAIKLVMSWTGASERTAKNWFAGRRGPSGKHLVALVHHSDRVLDAVLKLAGRERSSIAVKLIAARSRLAETLASIDELLATDRTTDDNDPPHAAPSGNHFNSQRNVLSPAPPTPVIRNSTAAGISAGAGKRRTPLR
jgi:hypothetical protein